jgi:hypothetical protein
MIDTLAVIGNLVLVYVFGWGGGPLMMLIMVSVFNGICFQEEK